MSDFIAIRETNLDQDKFHWLVAISRMGTLHGYIFFNPDNGGHFSQFKTDARCYETIESCEAQIALLESLGVSVGSVIGGYIRETIFQNH